MSDKPPRAATKPMVVEGAEVTPAQIDAALSVMDRHQFTWHDVIRALVTEGVPPSCADRAADRLLQRERRAGRIAVSSRRGGKVIWTCNSDIALPLTPQPDER